MKMLSILLVLPIGRSAIVGDDVLSMTDEQVGKLWKNEAKLEGDVDEGEQLELCKGRRGICTRCKYARRGIMKEESETGKE
jgi:hypothetical protein